MTRQELLKRFGDFQGERLKAIDFEGLVIKAINAVLDAPAVVSCCEQLLQLRQLFFDVLQEQCGLLMFLGQFRVSGQRSELNRGARPSLSEEWRFLTGHISF